MMRLQLLAGITAPALVNYKLKYTRVKTLTNMPPSFQQEGPASVGGLLGSPRCSVGHYLASPWNANGNFHQDFLQRILPVREPTSSQISVSGRSQIRYIQPPPLL